MQRPSFSVIFSGIFIAYMLHSIWTIGSLFIPPKCTDVKAQRCVSSYLETKPKLQLLLFSTTKESITTNTDLSLISAIPIDHVLDDEFEKVINLSLPHRTRKNGTMFLHTFLVKSSFKDSWPAALNDPNTVYAAVELTQYHVPEAQTFNLLGSTQEDVSKEQAKGNPVTHLKSKVVINILNHVDPLPTKDLPLDIGHLLSLSPNRQYLPSLFIDQLSSRLQDLVPVNTSVKEYPVKFVISPISFGKLRLWMQFTGALQTLRQMGFTEKDVDEIKGIFADTNVVFLCATFLVASLHLLFDFLAFKNDISFWKNRENMIGVSTRTLLWRMFSQIVVFFYLMDESTSLLVLVPAAVGAVIEVWKVAKAFRVTIKWSGFLPKLQRGQSNKEEQETEAYDGESMKYLSYLLYPLCLAGAVYSLIYTPHRSWYSWLIQSLVNGVYAFGFLFMLPQLFVNYKLKSVAHLPWRAFMYKAFNTFIDDVFAFIITMPTAHRVACFRDDIVFLVYLYQRWLYPVDKKRANEFGSTGEESEEKKTK